MKILGLIVEYNPMHNGHIYHIEKSKELVNPDITIAVMSGSFTQRGEPTILNKWDRTKIALENGIDLVVELPIYYSVQSADLFALGSVAILSKLGVTDICFGSEHHNIDDFHKILKAMENNEYEPLLKKHLKEGLSFPKASSLSIDKIIDFETLDITSNPNNILGIQYIKNAGLFNPNIKMHLIKRSEAHYHDELLPEGNIASASALRKAVLDGEDVSNYVPKLTNFYLESSKLLNWDDLYKYLKYTVITNSLDNLENIYGMNEGIHNLIHSEITKYNDYEGFIYNITSKRYTKSRIQRLLIYILLNITKDDISNELLYQGPQYIRILGFNKLGSKALNLIKKIIDIDLIDTISRNPSKLLKIDLKASRLYSLISNNSEVITTEFEKPIIY